ncbi:hypothetical protein D3C72_1849690 [compost metagenome]
MALYSIDRIIALTATDLPEPVVPATSRCGARARSVTTGLPVMSLPIASTSREACDWNAAPATISDSRIIWRFALGNSSPMQVLPGMVSTTRIDVTPSARARSFISPTTCAPRTPMAGSTSKRVMTGPALAPTTDTGTLNSARRWAISSPVSRRCASETSSPLSTADSSRPASGRR